jgi:hypothetical protein
MILIVTLEQAREALPALLIGVPIITTLWLFAKAYTKDDGHDDS